MTPPSGAAASIPPLLVPRKGTDNAAFDESRSTLDTRFCVLSKGLGRTA